MTAVRFISTAETARLLHLSEDTVRRRINAGRIWAATTENERQAIRRRRGIVAEPLMVAGISGVTHGPKAPDSPASCGTVAGYFVHVRRKKATCQPCRSAFAAYNRERKAKGKAS